MNVQVSLVRTVPNVKTKRTAMYVDARPALPDVTARLTLMSVNLDRVKTRGPVMTEPTITHACVRPGLPG